MYSPKLDTFLKLAAQGNLIPVTRRILADFETPLSAYQKISGQGESFLFESVEGGEHLGRYSFVGCNPRAIVRQTGDRVELRQNGKATEHFPVAPTPPAAAGAEPGFGLVGGEMNTYGKVEEFTVTYEPQAGGSSAVKDGLEVIERVMKHYRP